MCVCKSKRISSKLVQFGPIFHIYKLDAVGRASKQRWTTLFTSIRKFWLHEVETTSFTLEKIAWGNIYQFWKGCYVQLSANFFFLILSTKIWGFGVYYHLGLHFKKIPGNPPNQIFASLWRVNFLTLISSRRSTSKQVRLTLFTAVQLTRRWAGISSPTLLL